MKYWHKFFGIYNVIPHMQIISPCLFLCMLKLFISWFFPCSKFPWYLIQLHIIFYSIVIFFDKIHVLFFVYFNTFKSEEHTSELQSRFDLVCRLLLEKKNNQEISR